MAGRKRGKMLAFLIGWESATIYFFQPIATQWQINHQIRNLFESYS